MEAMKWDKRFDIVKYRDEHFAGDSGFANFPESRKGTKRGREHLLRSSLIGALVRNDIFFRIGDNYWTLLSAGVAEIVVVVSEASTPREFLSSPERHASSKFAALTDLNSRRT